MGARLKQAKKTISREAWAEFLKRTDESMENMDREMEKLLSYTLDKDHIDLEDVQAICVQQIQTKIFDMISAIAGKGRRKVMLLYQDLLAARESPMRILYLIVRQFRQMMVIQEMAQQRRDIKTIAETGGNAGFRCQEKYGVVQKFYQRADVRTPAGRGGI